MDVSRGAEDEESTAMDLVRRAQRGDISHQELVDALKGFPFKPQYRTAGQADDWELVEDSIDAALHAYISLNLLSNEEYEAIATVDDKAIAATASTPDNSERRPLPASAVQFDEDVDLA